MNECDLIASALYRDSIGIDPSDVSINRYQNMITYHYHTGDIVIRVSDDDSHRTVVTKYDSEGMMCADVRIDDFSISIDAIIGAIEYLMTI